MINFKSIVGILNKAKNIFHGDYEIPEKVCIVNRTIEKFHLYSYVNIVSNIRYFKKCRKNTVYSYSFSK